MQSRPILTNGTDSKPNLILIPLKTLSNKNKSHRKKVIQKVKLLAKFSIFTFVNNLSNNLHR